MVERNTIQQKIVFDKVEELYSKHIHATADEIFQAINLEHPTISRATVYRNLNKLVATGQVNRIEIPNSADCFDLVTKTHYHMKCIKCGQVSDVILPEVPSFIQSFKSIHGDEITGFDILFKGICSKCRKKHN